MPKTIKLYANHEVDKTCLNILNQSDEDEPVFNINVWKNKGWYVFIADSTHSRQSEFCGDSL